MKKRFSPEEHKKMTEKLDNIDSAKKARAFHREYKAYGYGLFWHDRYPNFPLWCIGVSVILSIAATFISIVKLLI